MTVRMRGAAAVGILLGALTGCSSAGPLPSVDGAARTVAGTATADPDAVAAYLKKKAVQRAGLDACHRWVAGYTPRVATHDAGTGATKVLKDSPSVAAFWAGMAPKLAAEYAAIDTEMAALPAVLTIAAPIPELVEVLTEYRRLITVYRSTVQAAQAAAAGPPNMWGGTNEAYKAVTDHMNAKIVTLCNRIEDE
ncbi:hypothetical protein [Tsukamurella pulmonis]|uniref:hypothetical protein n=1 Tax=Tsukamurella pulmonis TaxID=47312 RepID=UPI000A6493FC|nr:hypothetical protein [Tsukamurella pulmonis]